MKYYVYFYNQYNIKICHCFEQDKEQAEHFAKLVNGIIKYQV